MKKQGFKAKLAAKFAGWSMKKTVCVGLASAIVITGGAIGGIVAFRLNGSDKQASKPKAVKVKVIEKNKKGEIKIPTYASCAISGDSIEKDLTLYITQGTGSDSKISGTKFQIKLLKKDEAEKIKAADTKINLTKAYIKKAEELGVSDKTGTEDEISKVKDLVKKSLGIEEKKEEAKEADKKADSKDEEKADSKSNSKSDSKSDSKKADSSNDKDLDISADTKKPVTVKEALILEKQKEIAEFAKVLSDAKGETYTDEDSDGMIHVDKLEPGDYHACMVPLESFDADQYAVGVKVKEKVEFKAVKNIKKKAKKNLAESKPAQQPVEKLPDNTVEHVNSSKKEKIETVNVSGYNTSVGVIKPFPVESGSSSGHRRNLALNLLGVNTSLLSKKTASSTVTFNPLLWATENTNPGTLEENKTAVPGATVSTAETAKVYASNNASMSTKSFSVSSEGCNITSVSTDNGGLSATLSGGMIVITASTSIKEDTTVHIIIHTDKGNARATVVTVVGSSDQVKYNGKDVVYKDAGCKTPMTIADYSAQGYAKTGFIYYGWQTIDGHRYYFDKNGNKVTGDQVIQHIKYSFGSDGVLLTRGTGIDVSKWQGNINWSQAKSAISFAIIRCGYRGSGGGLGIDPYFKTNMANAKANGVKVGAYFYSKAQNEAQAVEEASLAVELVREAGGVSLPIYIDIEDGATQGGLSNAERTAIVHAFCRTVASAGYRPGVYAGMNWWLNKLNHDELTQYSVWIARYNSVLSGGRYIWNGKTDIWQYSSSGSVPGIGGRVDMNQSYF